MSDFGEDGLGEVEVLFGVIVLFFSWVSGVEVGGSDNYRWVGDIVFGVIGVVDEFEVGVVSEVWVEKCLV